MRFVSMDLNGVMPVRLMIGAALAMLAVLKIFVYVPVLDALLIRDFSTDAERWTRHLAAELERMESHVDFDVDPALRDEEAATRDHHGHDAGGHAGHAHDHPGQEGARNNLVQVTDAHASFARTMKTALASGSLSQVDVSVPGCDCVVRIVGSTDGTDLSGDTVVADMEAKLDALHSLLAGEIDGQALVGDAWGVALPPPVAEPGRDLWHTTIRSRTADGRAGWYGVTKAMVTTHGDREVVIRILTDVTGTAQGLTLLFWVLGGAAASVTALVVFLGTHQLRKSRQTGEMSERQARFLAEHDSLTGLYNRYGFAARAEALMATARTQGNQICLAQIDVDKFKDINDLHGHSAGDDILVQVARMIGDCFPEGALAARIGGDEFAVMVLLDDGQAGCLDLLADARTEVTADVQDGEHRQSIRATTSIGYAIFPRDGATLFELMKSADLALYNVKSEGRNGAGGYHPDMGRAFERRLWEIDGIIAAARNKDIVPHYQPIVNAATGDIEGLEALVRWRHPDLGLLTPVRFAHALADPAASRAVTGAMLASITRDLAEWWQAGYHFSVGLNVSEADLKSDTFLSEVIWALDSHDLPRRALAIEVTEQSVNRRNLDEMSQAIRRLRDESMYVALDDFGTDGSSLSILRALPCTAIKIDKSFTERITCQPEDLSIVEAMIALGHALGLKIVAEGVETREQRDVLRAAGADLLQGHLFDQALPAEEISRRLPSWRIAPRVKTRAA